MKLSLISHQAVDISFDRRELKSYLYKALHPLYCGISFWELHSYWLESSEDCPIDMREKCMLELELSFSIIIVILWKTGHLILNIELLFVEKLFHSIYSQNSFVWNYRRIINLNSQKNILLRFFRTFTLHLWYFFPFSRGIFIFSFLFTKNININRFSRHK